jgi:hypothetical protein
VNVGRATAEVTLTDALPPGVELVPGSARAESGSAITYDAEKRTLMWTGTVPAHAITRLYFLVRVVGDVDTITNTAVLDDGFGNRVELETTTRVVGYRHFLPLIWKMDDG